MRELAIVVRETKRIIKLHPFMPTKKVQARVAQRTGIGIDGRTVHGMKLSLHRSMVRMAA